MVKATKKRRTIFDDEADWVPQKGRMFTLKTRKDEEEQPQQVQEDKIKTDAEGEDRAYADGDTFVEDDKSYVAGSHTLTDWFDGVTKIPQWQKVPGGLIPIVDIMNTWWGRKILGTGDLRQAERYKRGRDALFKSRQGGYG